MTEQERQLIEQLADLRRDEVTRLTAEDRKPQSMDTGMGLTEEELTMWQPETKEEAGGSNPKQYGLPADAKELQDLIEYRGMNFAQGNIFKAQYRAGHCSHSDELRDARKTLWFAQREVKRLSHD